MTPLFSQPSRQPSCLFPGVVYLGFAIYSMHLQLIRLNPSKAMFYFRPAQIKELSSFFGLPEATDL